MTTGVRSHSRGSPYEAVPFVRFVSYQTSVLRGASWGAHGTIIFGTEGPGGLWRVAAAGGTPEPLTDPNREEGEIDHFWPEILL